MDSMMDKVEVHMMKEMFKVERQSMLTHLYIIDDMMSEILILDNPEAMREIALYVKEVVKSAEKV